MEKQHRSGPPVCPAEPRHEPPLVIPAQIRRVNNLIQRLQNQIGRSNGIEDVTAMHGWILKYLQLHEGQDVYQRDIEREFSITRSTVTNILQLMEKKGYIRREAVEHDARLKRLVLTEEGRDADRRMLLTLRQTDTYLESLLTPEERDEMLRLLLKLRSSLEERPLPLPETPANGHL